MSFFSNTWINGASSQVDVVGGLSGGCYLYFSDNSRLTIPVATGLVEIAYATFSGNTGLAPGFTATPIDSPISAKSDFNQLVWNYDSASVTALAQIFDVTFDGVVSYIILDGVNYIINQGVGATPNQPIPSSPAGSPVSIIIDVETNNWLQGDCGSIPSPPTTESTYTEEFTSEYV